MGNPPFRPLREIQRELQRGNLDIATAIAKDFARAHHRPIPLDAALAFLPLVASKQGDSYDVWACHWLVRWLNESRQADIDRTADLAAALAELPADPDTALGTIREELRPSGEHARRIDETHGPDSL